MANETARRDRALRLDISVNDAEVGLSDVGVTQAEALGAWLGKQPDSQRPTAVVVSPYARTRDTADVVLRAAGLAGVPVRYDERLRDREQGVLDRLTMAGFRDQFPEEADRQGYVGKFWYRPTGGESWADVVARVRSALLEIRLFCPDERLLVVTHDMPILAFRYVLEDMTPDEVVKLSGQVENCSVTRYERDGDRLLLQAFSDTTAVEESVDVPVTRHE